ncbi:UDP-glycosyltransferase 76B1 [Citrus sinensis]|nr:UDP-glycosyltransferase 76B1 [Citrus sinensis]
MGRKAVTLYINPKKFGNIAKPCMEEMITFLNCLSLNQMNSENCVRQKDLLSACMDGLTNKKRKPWGSINHNLQWLNKGRKYSGTLI